ncbi:galactose-specific lectin nattectin-like [Sparus aurata]|uniref:galactose-specific lectin nattectin-like n=1 Tax=Sparus aurata TaxID=8175 RepID=UPI0011C15950|nr:galactose-specific lectin nattectin-like isoform X1 [Sparus aurata]XP_030279546.1 galactose-specific lectin nattectin-like [Sparus aurata]
MASALPLIVLLCLAVGPLDGFFLGRLGRHKPFHRRWSRCSRCFFVETRKLTLADAEQNCIRRGGNLASIHSSREQRTIGRMLGKASTKLAWIGLFDAIQEGKWLWTDGSRLTFTRWARKRPDNFRGKEHCTHMYSRGNVWNDINCDAKLPSVCRRRR